MSVLKDIAGKLGISVSTVSRVVNNKAYVKPKTREMVMRALEELNYTPNQIARSLKNNSTRTIGIVVPDISENFFALIIKGVDSILSKNGYSIILCDTDENPDKEEAYLKLLLEKRVDGFVLATISKRNKLIEKLVHDQIPVIFIDNLPDISSNYDSVLIDNNKAGYRAAEHLIRLGHTNIAVITGLLDETTGYERLEGFKKALQNYHIEVNPDRIRIGNFKEDSGYDHMKSLLESDPGLSAVFVASSKMTYGAIKAIRDAGLKMPDDIALVGFDMHDDSGLLSPGITTLIQPERLIGRVAGEQLLKRLKDKEDQFNQKVILEPELVIRESCGHKLKVK